MNRPVLAQALDEHLHSWGLQRFTSDQAYFQWQRTVLGTRDLNHLNELAARKRAAGSGSSEEIAFYDFSAHPNILPVLYSQRYDYFMTVGPLVEARVPPARSVLDFGCGVGILTTFYARRHPEISFVGIDRSRDCIAAAHKHASAYGLTNVRFECLDSDQEPVLGTYDLIVSTHALLQSESDPGLPSVDWRSFARAIDPNLQIEFEQRTGLARRLDSIYSALTPDGRLLVLEKTRQLARRVPFQRALAARGLTLFESPIPVRYSIVEEIADDGPLYVAGRSGRPREKQIEWDENPEQADEDEWYCCRGEAAKLIRRRLAGDAVRNETWDVSGIGPLTVERGTFRRALAYLYVTDKHIMHGIVTGRPQALAVIDPSNPAVQAFLASPTSSDSPDPASPLYENHTVAAQAVWAALPDRHILRTQTLEEAGGRQLHVELGTVPGLVYLYWANTFDQRQVVIVEQEQQSMLEQYYQEFLDGR